MPRARHLGSHLVWRARQEPSSWLAFVDEVIARIAVGVRVFERSSGRRIRLERIGQGQSGELTYLRWGIPDEWRLFAAAP